MATCTIKLTEKDLADIVSHYYGVEVGAVKFKHDPGCGDQRDYTPPSVSAEIDMPAVARPHPPR